TGNASRATTSAVGGGGRRTGARRPPPGHHRAALKNGDDAMSAAARPIAGSSVQAVAWRRRSARRALTFYAFLSPWLVGFALLTAFIGSFSPATYLRWLVEYPTVVLSVFVIWAAAGGGMVIFLAGLQGIPAEYREAAMIDGASPWQVTRFVTLPLLSPVIFFQ